jgi:hypothetical protein
MRNKDLTVQTDAQTIAPAVLTGSGDYTEGATVDGKNASAVRHILAVGESGDTWSGSLYTDVILQHSTDNSEWAAVTSSADFIGSMETQASGIVKVLDAEADDNANYEVTYVGPRRYSRLYLGRVGNHSSGTPMAAIAIVQPRLSGSVSPS